MKILYVEDERHLALAVKKVLETRAIMVDLAFDGDSGLLFATSSDYDVIVLDMMLPKLSGEAILEALRTQGISTPVLFLTAKSALNQVVDGLNRGADDYLTKPFQMDELVARLHALNRRNTKTLVPDVITYKQCHYHALEHTVAYEQKVERLTPKESMLLKLLISHPNQIIPTSMITDALWSWDDDPIDNHVHVHISLLRKKLKAIHAPFEIKTVYASGYMLRDAS